jgi:hypothetical protein
MQAGQVIRVRTLSTTQFAVVIGANGGAALVNMAPGGAAGQVPESLAAGRHCRSRLREVQIISSKKIPWSLQLHRSASGVGGAVIDSDPYLGEIAFSATGAPGDGSQATGDTFFYFGVQGLDMAYEDTDETGKVHVRLINRDPAVAFNGGAGDSVVVELCFEPLQGR